MERRAIYLFSLLANNNIAVSWILPFLFVCLGFMAFLPKPPLACIEEICNNAIDDDNDGWIDLNDPDCYCEIVELVSMIPNPSFEEMNCCPDDKSQLECVTDWIQASEATTDYIHTCDYMGWPQFPPPLPFPDGQGVMGFRDGRILNGQPERNWKEYAGACLLAPLEKDSSYRFEFYVGFVSNTLSPPINISVFGTPDCQYLPFGIGDKAFGCPTNGPNWVKLESTLVTGTGGQCWIKSSITITPDQNIKAIAIGPDCAPVLASQSIYYFFDNLVLADSDFFGLDILPTNHPCQNDFSLQVKDYEDYNYQWYKEGVALIGETEAELSMLYGEGNYQVRILDGNSCRLSANYNLTIPISSSFPHREICQEATFDFGGLIINESGSYIDTFKTVNNCDSIVNLTINVLSTLADTIAVQLFDGEIYEVGNYKIDKAGDHLLTLSSAVGCDSLLLVQLDYFYVYIPNVFSPNGDGLNDIFKIYSEDGMISSSDIMIFDRWGSTLHKGSQWDGKQESEFMNPGVYVYAANVVFKDGFEKRFSGSVTLLR